MIQQLLCQMICGLIDTQSRTALIDEEVSHQLQVPITTMMGENETVDEMKMKMLHFCL